MSSLAKASGSGLFFWVTSLPPLTSLATNQKPLDGPNLPKEADCSCTAQSKQKPRCLDFLDTMHMDRSDKKNKKETKETEIEMNIECLSEMSPGTETSKRDIGDPRCKVTRPLNCDIKGSTILYRTK